jgi:hypothetical protein
MCIYIPDEIWHDPSLSLFERCFMGKIMALSQKDGVCWAGDNRLAEYMTCTPSYVRKAIRKLKESGHLTVKGYGQSRKLVPNGTSDNRNKFQMEQKLGHMEQVVGPNGTKVGPNGPQTIEHTIEHTKEHTTEGNLEGFGRNKVTLPWDTPAFRDAWVGWKHNRMEMGLPAYSKIQEQGALHELQNDTEGDEATAIDAIKYSISKTYKAIYLRKTRNNAKQNQRSGPADGSLIAEHLRRLADESGQSMG